MKMLALRAISNYSADFEKVERIIKRAFREVLYHPILKELELPRSVLVNAADSPLQEAIAQGRITFNQGLFSGRFSAAVSKELKALGATWDRKALGFRLTLAQMPYDLQAAISASAARFDATLKRIDTLIGKKVPEEITSKVKVADIFDDTLWKVDRAIADTLKGISVPAQLTDERRQRIAEEWQENLDKWIKDFTEEEILRLRQSVAKSVFSGNRRDSVIRSIQKSYGVSANKAKFLARQETNLLLAKFKEARYTDSGVPEYKWRCVAGSKHHPVRPSHKILDGKIFRWDTPPITTAPDEPSRRNNPGEDYGCRCTAIPMARFKK